jgi:hypothetical protein
MPFLDTASTLMCPHGGSVSAASADTSVSTAQGKIVLQTDTFTIAGCPFVIGPNPHPCVQVQWASASIKWTIAGNPPLLDSSSGLCLAADGAPQGSVLVVVTEQQVSGV